MKKIMLKPFKKTAQWMVLFWNIFAAFLHYEIFHFPIFTAIFSQVFAFLVEYAVAAYYQKQILKYDAKIIAYTTRKDIPILVSYLWRYGSFLMIYWAIFLSTYLGRLWILSLKPVGLWIEDITFRLFGQVAQMELVTKDIERTVIVACWSSFFFALVIPVSLIWKRKIQRKMVYWGWRGKLCKKNQKKLGLRSFLSLHIAVRSRA